MLTRRKRADRLQKQQATFFTLFTAPKPARFCCVEQLRHTASEMSESFREMIAVETPDKQTAAPARLLFSLGGFEADGIEVRLSGGQILYSNTVGPFPAQPPQGIHATEAQWCQFWQDLDRIGVWAWQPDYINPDVLDGTQWSLSLCHGGRELECEGSNAYPGSPEIEYPDDGPFADFLRALARLTGKPDIAPQTR
jgi:hypothetical protein